MGFLHVLWLCLLTLSFYHFLHGMHEVSFYGCIHQVHLHCVYPSLSNLRFILPWCVVINCSCGGVFTFCGMLYLGSEVLLLLCSICIVSDCALWHCLFHLWYCLCYLLICPYHVIYRYKTTLGQCATMYKLLEQCAIVKNYYLWLINVHVLCCLNFRCVQIIIFYQSWSQYTAQLPGSKHLFCKL